MVAGRWSRVKISGQILQRFKSNSIGCSTVRGSLWISTSNLCFTLLHLIFTFLNFYGWTDLLGSPDLKETAATREGAVFTLVSYGSMGWVISLSVWLLPSSSFPGIFLTHSLAKSAPERKLLVLRIIKWLQIVSKWVTNEYRKISVESYHRKICKWAQPLHASGEPRWEGNSWRKDTSMGRALRS